MRQRAKVWAARAFLLLSVVAPLAFVAYEFIPYKIQHSHNFWPYGHVHNVAEVIGVLASYVVGTVGGIAAGVIAVLVASFTTFITFKVTIAVARRKPHHRWIDLWRETPPETRELMTYDTPAPLIRGRVGSR